MKQLLLLYMMLPFSAAALGPVKFGPEFTFMPDESCRVGSVLYRFIHHVIDEQPEGAKFKHDFGYLEQDRFVSPNGWWFTCTNDSGGNEVQMSPMTVEMWKRYESDIQDAVFVSAANEGHFPAMFQGGGHINIGTDVFERDPLLYRNFIVDLISHNELFMGVFNYDYRNATPFQLDPRFEERMRDTLDAMDSWTEQSFTLASLKVHHRNKTIVIQPRI